MKVFLLDFLHAIQVSLLLYFGKSQLFSATQCLQTIQLGLSLLNPLLSFLLLDLLETLSLFLPCLLIFDCFSDALRFNFFILTSLAFRLFSDESFCSRSLHQLLFFGLLHDFKQSFVAKLVYMMRNVSIHLFRLLFFVGPLLASDTLRLFATLLFFA